MYPVRALQSGRNFVEARIYATEKVIGRVSPTWAWKSRLGKELNHWDPFHICRSKISRLATRKQKKNIKKCKNFTAGLMDGRDDSSAIKSNVSKGLNNKERRGAVKAASGFIQKQETRPCKDFKSNAHSLLLPTTHTSQMPVPYKPISTILKTHFHNCCLYNALYFFFGQASGKSQMSRLEEKN